MTKKINPGPGTSICPIHGNVWLKTVRPVLKDEGITLSGDCDYKLYCSICGSPLTDGLL